MIFEVYKTYTTFMFDKHQRRIKRSAKLISVLSKYGFQDLLIRMGVQGDFSKSSTTLQTLTIYERMKLALEELGPTFIKLGQTFSNREDLLPIELIQQLEKLQDDVVVLDLDVHSILEEELNINIHDHFLNISQEPLAAASIAQVYKATLLDETPVIIKIKRPNIDQVIKDDLMLLKDLVKLIDTYSEIGDKINLKNAVNAFEKSLLEELSLINEKNNIQQFQTNFKDNPETYVPKVYDQFCTNNILCMEFVDGIKITDAASLRLHNLNPALISETGLRLFISQILDFGFFHADPHAGNILITKSGKVCFIDFGAVGQIQPNDKELLEGLIINFLAKKPQKIVRNLKKISLYYNIPDEREFENDVADILNFIHNKSLKDINVPEIINKMKDVLKQNRLVMPDYFYLLFKGVSLIDGVGRTINPELDVVKSLKPYSEKIIFERLNPQNILKKGWGKASNFLDHVEEIPEELRSILHKLDENKFSVSTEIKNMNRIEYLIKSSIINLILGMVLSANIISTAVLWAGEIGPKVWEIHILPIIGIIISLLLINILILRVLRR